MNNIHNLQSQHVPPIPDFDKITGWLQKYAPQDPDKLTLIHGDLKIDNILFDPKSKTVCGVLDWELTTVGNPLLTWLISYKHSITQQIESYVILSSKPKWVLKIKLNSIFIREIARI